MQNSSTGPDHNGWWGNGLDHKSTPSKTDRRFCKSYRPDGPKGLSPLLPCPALALFLFAAKLPRSWKNWRTLSFWARCISHSKNFQSSRQNPSYISFLKPPKSLPPTTNEIEIEIEISAEESTRRDMDLSDIARKLGFSDSKPLLLRKAQELRRLCDVHFDSSIIGIVSISPSIESILLLFCFPVFDFSWICLYFVVCSGGGM